LFAELENLSRLRLRLHESPADRLRPLRVIAGGGRPLELSAPLPEVATLVVENGRSPLVVVAGEQGPEGRPHAPGGASAVYDGTPLLIVPGTAGGAASRAALWQAAVAASRSPNPAWAEERGDTWPESSDNTPHHQPLFGSLPIRADTQISDEELRTHNLVLIGTAEENSVVRRLAGRLPVKVQDGEVACDDGVSWREGALTSALVYRNPEAPLRLIFWVASHSPDGYRAGALAPLLAAGHLNHPVNETHFFHAADLIVTTAESATLVAARSMDSRWQWNDARASSRRLPPALATREGLALGMAEAARKAVAADFAMAWALPPLGREPVRAGQTRVSDLAALFYGHPIDLVEVSGKELLEAAERIAQPTDRPETWRALTPAVEPQSIEPGQRYRIALPVLQLTPYARATLTTPARHRRTETPLAEALERFLVP